MEDKDFSTFISKAMSAGAVEYADYISPEVVSAPINECPGYDIKESDNEAPALGLWGIQSTPSLPSLLCPFWPGEVAPDRILSMGQTELFEIQPVWKQMTNPKLNS